MPGKFINEPIALTGSNEPGSLTRRNTAAFRGFLEFVSPPTLRAFHEVDAWKI